AKHAIESARRPRCPVESCLIGQKTARTKMCAAGTVAIDFACKHACFSAISRPLASFLAVRSPASPVDPSMDLPAQPLFTQQLTNRAPRPIGAGTARAHIDTTRRRRNGVW